MRRWNGWGDEAVEYPVPESARRYLREQIGVGEAMREMNLAEALLAVPRSRLPEHPLISTAAEDRLRHARGQSLPDWVALRSGQIEAYPDGVAFPETEEEIGELIQYAGACQAALIPYGGGTSVVGHINPMTGERPTVTVDLGRMKRMIHLDRISHLAHFQAGICGPELEAQLRAEGFTLGHFPQSFEYSTLGGWIATRSCGQQSRYYGRIEDMFAGGRVATPAGVLELPELPASAAGPDLRQVILGSEGRFGLITRAAVRVRPLPEVEAFYGVFFKEWQSGVTAVRQMVQAGAPLSMLRLSDPLETQVTLKLSGKDRLVSWADRGLRAIGYPEDRCLLIFGVTGDRRTARRAKDVACEIAGANAGLFTGEMIGKTWRKSRFLTPYIRNSLWQLGYGVDTLETAVPWSRVIETAQSIQEAIRSSLAASGEAALVFSHLSHVYTDGASIYTTIIFRLTAEPGETLRRWEAFKRAASQVIVAHGGTISHQHGVGSDHAPYLVYEKGRLGLEMIEALRCTLDPDNMMNPGKLTPH